MVVLPAGMVALFVSIFNPGPGGRAFSYLGGARITRSGIVALHTSIISWYWEIR